MREIFNFLNFGEKKEKRKKKRKRNIEVSKIFTFGNLKTVNTKRRFSFLRSFGFIIYILQTGNKVREDAHTKKSVFSVLPSLH